MIELQQIYRDIQSTLPFSITGYNSIEERLYHFYDSIVESTLLQFNDKFCFLFSAVLEFEKDKKFKSIREWNVKPYEKFYFKALVNSDKRALLSIYFWILKNVHEKLYNEEKEVIPSLTFSNLFNKDFDFCVRINHNINEPFLDWDDRKAQLLIELPGIIFNPEITQANHRMNILIDFREKDFAKYGVQQGINESSTGAEQISDDNKYRVISGQNYARYFTKVNQTSSIIDNIYEKIFVKLYNFKELKNQTEHLEKLLSALRNSHFHYLEEEALKQAYKYLIVSCIGLSYICYHYECSIEYFTGIAKAEPHGSRINKRNLGGLILGYKDGTHVSNTERVIFNIISDHLVSVVAGNYLFNHALSKQEKAKHYQQIRKKYYKEIVDNIGGNLHLNEEIPESDLSLYSSIKDKYSDQVPGISAFFDDAISISKSCNKLDYLLLSNSSNSDMIGKMTADFHNHIPTTCKEVPEIYKFCNIQLFDRLTQELLHPSQTNRNVELIKSQIGLNDDILEIEITVKQDQKFDISRFYELLSDSSHSNGLTSILKKHYNLILAHGNIQFVYLNDREEFVFFDLMKSIVLNTHDKIEVIDNLKYDEEEYLSNSDGKYHYKYIYEIK